MQLQTPRVRPRGSRLHLRQDRQVRQCQVGRETRRRQEVRKKMREERDLREKYSQNAQISQKNLGTKKKKSKQNQLETKKIFKNRNKRVAKFWMT